MLSRQLKSGPAVHAEIINFSPSTKTIQEIAGVDAPIFIFNILTLSELGTIDALTQCSKYNEDTPPANDL